VARRLHALVSNGSPRVNTEILTSCLFTGGSDGTVSILLRRNASKEWIAEPRRRMSGAGSFRPVAYLQISIFRAGSADAVLPAAEELARKALSRL
jgi:LPS sulfotransferase NodH